jgi:hypothetical protein
MSYTIVHKVPQTGAIATGFDIQNAWLGAMHIWERMYWRYCHVGRHDEYAFGMVMTRDLDRKDSLKQVWDLAKRSEPTILHPFTVPLNDRIVLATTFDKVMVKREHLPRLIEAFHAFMTSHGGTDNMRKQVQAFEKLSKDEECYAVCWTQTSVVADAWMVYEPDEDDHRQYDISIDTGHWFLFDDEAFKAEVGE